MVTRRSFLCGGAVCLNSLWMRGTSSCVADVFDGEYLECSYPLQGKLTGACFFPSGQQVAFVEADDTTHSCRLMVVRLGAQIAPAHVVDLHDTMKAFSVAISPDESMIAVARRIAGTTKGDRYKTVITVVNVSAREIESEIVVSEERTPLNREGRRVSMGWTSNEQMIASIESDPNLYRVSVSGGKSVIIANYPQFLSGIDYELAWWETPVFLQDGAFAVPMHHTVSRKIPNPDKAKELRPIMAKSLPDEVTERFLAIKLVVFNSSCKVEELRDVDEAVAGLGKFFIAATVHYREITKRDGDELLKTREFIETKSKAVLATLPEVRVTKAGNQKFSRVLAISRDGKKLAILNESLIIIVRP